ncbi:MAG: PilZ domain-containing protein [Candidatus Omnitrophota bacterium]
MLEKRRFVRFDSSVNVHYQILEEGQQIREASSRDISAGGIRIIIKEKIPMGTQLEMEIILPNEKRTIQLVGEVVWQQESDTGDVEVFDTGIKFVKISSSNILKITSYIINSLKKNIESERKTISDCLAKKLTLPRFLTKEIRLPGDNSQTMSVPDFLVREIRVPGDKTIYVQIKAGISLHYKLLDGTEEGGKSLSQYISGGDVWFLLERELLVDTMLKLKIELINQPLPIVIIGKVVVSNSTERCSDNEIKTFYETNVKYVSISPEDKKKIIRYIYSCHSDYIMLGKEPPPDWKKPQM